jgi:glutamate N-acetyltransferase / amino-acid N-acetyltransferase
LRPAKFPDLPEVRGLKAATGSRGFYARRGVVRDDVFLFVFDEGTTCGGVFTRSLTASADVRWCREALEKGGGQGAGAGGEFGQLERLHRAEGRAEE